MRVLPSAIPSKYIPAARLHVACSLMSITACIGHTMVMEGLQRRAYQSACAIQSTRRDRAMSMTGMTPLPTGESLGL